MQKFIPRPIVVPRPIIEMADEDILRIPIYCHLYTRMGLDGKMLVSLPQLAEACGQKSNRSIKGINNRIQNVLHLFRDLGYIKILEQDCYRIFLLVNHSFFNEPESYALITLDELSKLSNYQPQKDEAKIRSYYLLAVLSYIRLHIHQRGITQSTAQHPEIFYSYITSIGKRTNISRPTVKRSIQALEDLDIIVTRQLPSTRNDSNLWKAGLTIFANKKEGWLNELAAADELLNDGSAPPPAIEFPPRN